MKMTLIAVAAIAACSVVAMPTGDELAKATKEVQAALESQIAAYESGSISDGDLAVLMLRRSRWFRDAQRFACLQMALEAAVRVSDVALTAEILEKIAADTKDFGRKESGNLVIGALKNKGDAKKADKADAEIFGSTRFIPDLEIELEKRAYKKSVSISDRTAYTVALMKHISLTTFDVKPQTTLAEVVTFLNIASRTHDRHAKLHTGWNGVKIVLKTAKGEPVPTVPEVHGKRYVNVYNAVEFITKATGYDFEVKDKTVVIFKKDGAAKK